MAATAWGRLLSDELVQQRLHRRSFDGEYQSGHEGERIDDPEVVGSTGDDETNAVRKDRRHLPMWSATVGGCRPECQHSGRGAEEQQRQELQCDHESQAVARPVRSSTSHVSASAWSRYRCSR
ncbi:MAG: hypothetical protein R2705_17500 [Ilumatobacteraceae bacterium]